MEEDMFEYAKTHGKPVSEEESEEKILEEKIEEHKGFEIEDINLEKLDKKQLRKKLKEYVAERKKLNAQIKILKEKQKDIRTFTNKIREIVKTK